MNRRQQITVTCLVVALLAGLLFWATRPREPVYQGKRLSEWIEELDWDQPHAVQGAARHAVRELKYVALPVIEKRVCEFKHPASMPAYRRLVWRLVATILPLRHKTPDNRWAQYFLAMQVIGPDAVPALSRLLQRNETTIDAAEVLATLSMKGLPPLTNALTHSSSYVRRAAASALGQLRPPTIDAVSALLRSFDDKEDSVSVAAIAAVGELKAMPDLVVPELIARLEATNSYVRYNAALALGDYGKQAKHAIPKLQALLGDPETFVRNGAEEALIAIDPDAAAKAGVKQ